MQQIDVDFEVWKALTLRRASERTSYNDVLRELLGLALTNRAIEDPVLQAETEPGYNFRGLCLPEGTKIRAMYKRKSYAAEIRNGRWIDDMGLEHTSPSAAARHVTGNSVNGWRFWEVRRPHDREWRKIEALSGARP